LSCPFAVTARAVDRGKNLPLAFLIFHVSIPLSDRDGMQVLSVSIINDVYVTLWVCGYTFSFEVDLVGTVYQILIIIGFIVATIFSLIVFFTGKGDAMSGGSGIRTTFKGKASFDDIMSKVAFYFGISFMAITLLLNVIAARYKSEVEGTVSVKAPVSAPLK
jgi:preprotein translocase subunit SecG